MMNYVAQLNEYVQKSRCELKYDDVRSEGPAHIKTFTQRVILNGQSYPEGVGKSKKEARQNAAKRALGELETQDPSNSLVSGLSVSNSTQPVNESKLTQPNYICWLNEHSQKNRVSLSAVETTAVELDQAKPCCRFILDGTDYPTAFGRTKKEAKEEAARLAYQEICSNPLSRSCSVDPSSHQTRELNQDISEATGSLGNVEVSTSLTEPNYIGLLNQHCQKSMRHLDFPFVRKCGPAHCPQFFYRVVIGGKEYPEVHGKTAKEARQRAAKEAWLAIQEQSDWDKSTSEEDAASNKAPPELGSHNSSNSSTSWIQLGNGPESPKGEKLDCKSKIRLAVTFTNVPKEQSLKKTPTEKKSTSENATSRFLKDYDNIAHLGKGGFGHVFKARLKHLDKYNAVKIVRFKDKALREAKFLSELQHPNIVRYYCSWIEASKYTQPTSESESFSYSKSNSDSSAHYLYIEMELCETNTLKEWIEEKNKLQDDPTRGKECLDIMRKIMCGVEYIHSKSLVHRDLKPSNIMFGSNEVKIVDFGLVTEDMDDVATQLDRTSGTGTKSYMAPEQSGKNTYDKKVDIFAMGLVYFMMLWNMAGHERVSKWGGIRQQKFPEGFAEKFPKEQRMIHLMLRGEPKSRPSAKEILVELGESDSLQGNEGSPEK